MRTASKRPDVVRCLCAAIFMLVVLGSSLAGAAGEGPVSVYRANKDRIIAEKLCAIGEYIFTVGIARPRSQSTAARLAAVDKATLHAESRLRRLVFAKVDWPAHVSPGQKDIYIRQYLNVTPLTIKTSGKLRVDSGRWSTQYFAVLALPRHAIEVPSADFRQIRQALDAAFSKGASTLSLADYLEVCPTKRIAPVVSTLAGRFAARYGPAVGQVTAGVPVTEPGTLWQKGKRLPFEKIADLSRDALLQLLGLCPYDPVVLYALGKAYERDGRPRAAQLYYLRGTVWILGDGYDAKCRSALREDYFTARVKRPGPEFAGLSKKVRARYGSVGPLQGKLADLVVRSMGTMPLRYAGPEPPALQQVQTLLQGQSPDLERAQRLLETALDTAPSHAMFALLARVLEMRGQSLLALPFRRQAGSMPSA